MYVYFIRAFKQKPLVKIGRSKDPKSRLCELQIGSPVKLGLIGTVRCAGLLEAKRVEKLFHRIFSKQNRRGEWFSLSYKQYELLKRLSRLTAEEWARTDEGTANMERMDAEYRAIVS